MKVTPTLLTNQRPLRGPSALYRWALALVCCLALGSTYAQQCQIGYAPSNSFSILALNANGQAVITEATVSPYLTSNCSTAPFNVDLFVDPQLTVPYNTSTVYNCAAVGNFVTFYAQVGGNSAGLFFEVQIVDLIPPSITCPANVTVGVDAGMCTAVVNNLAVTVADECSSTGLFTSYRINGGTAVSSNDPNNPVDPSGETFQIGTSTVVYEVFDGSNNFNTCSFTVTVSSPNAPAVIADQTESAAMNACSFTLTQAYVNALDPTTGAACFDNFTVTSPAIGTALGLGSTTINYSYTVNPNGPSPTTATASFTITVTDNQAPTLSFPDQSVVATACTATYSFDGNPTNNPTLYIADNCPSNTTATALIVSYTITGPNNFSTSGTGYDINNLVLPVGDNYTVTYTAEDASGNSNTGSFDLDVVENTPPVAACQDVTAQLDANGTVTITALQFENGSTDNCTVDSTMLQFAFDNGNGMPANVQGNAQPDFFTSFDFDCGALGTTDLLYRVTDNSGNVSALCPVTLTIQDTDNPIAQCQAITRNITNGVAVLVDATELDNGSNDNCNTIVGYELSVDTDGDGIVDSPFASTYSFDCTAGVGVYNVELRVTDSSGSTSRCPTTITIVDNTNPVANAMSYSASFGANGTVTVTAADFDNGSTDECSGVTLTYAFGTGPAAPGFVNGTVQPTVGYQASRNLACSAAGMHNVFVRATDGSGNTNTTGPVTLTLSDTTPPTASCVSGPFSYTYDALGMTTITAAQLNSGSSDNCGLTSVLVYDPLTQTSADAAASITFGCNNATPPTSLTLRVMDAAGQFDECTVALSAMDVVPPTPVCVNTSSVGLSAMGVAFLNVAQIDNGSFDVCGTVVSTTISRTPADASSYGQTVNFTCADLAAPVKVTLRVEDAAGLVNFCEVDVEVQDNLAPVVATTATNMTIECSDYSSTMMYGAAPTATDNCGTPTLTMADAPQSGSNCSGTVVRTFTFTDADGNTVTTTQTLTLEDTTAPTFTAPADVAADCVASVADTTITLLPGGGADNCDTNLDTIVRIDFAAYRDFEQSSTMNGVSYDFSPGNAIITGGTTTGTGAGVNLSGAPASIALQSGTSGDVRYGYTAPATGFFIFEYSRTSTSSNPNHNNFGYLVNGNPVDLDQNGTVNADRVVVPVQNNDFFQFYQLSNGSGSATTTVSNFAFATGVPVGINCTDNRDVARVFSLTDECGNTGYDAQYITVRDAAAPVLNYTLTGTIPTDTDQCGAQLDLDFSAAGRVSNGGCGQGFTVAYTVTPDPGQGNGTDDASGFYGPGTYTVDVDLTDDCFGTTTTSFSFTVADNQVPEAQCLGNFNVTLDNNNQASITVADIDNNSSDNCAIDYAASSVSPSSFDQTNIGQAVPVTLTIVDINGNSSTCVTTVEVNGITTLTAGTATGPTGSTVQVPVTVENLTDAAGFQLGLALADSSIAKIVGISNLNPALTGTNPGTTTTLNNGTLTFAYNNGGNGSTSLSLPNGTQLFTLTVVIEPSPTAMTGQQTDVVLFNNEVSFYPSGSTVPVVGASAVNNGLVIVGAPGAQQPISGAITAASTGNAVADVSVQLSGTTNGSTQTGTTGTYGFSVPTGADATITPTKNTNWSGSGNVNVADVLAIQNNIATPGNLSNWQQVAGDVNGSGSLSIIDAVLAVQIAFGQEFPTLTSSWKFAADPLDADPLANGFDQQHTFTDVQQPITNADFVGIKTADLAAPFTDGANLTGGVLSDDRNAEQLEFRYENRTLAYDETYTVQLLAQDFADVRGFQHTISFDETLVELVSVAPTAALPNFTLTGNFDQSGATEGQVSVLWYETAGVSLDDETAVLELTFRALHNNVLLSEVLAADDARIIDLSVFADGAQRGVRYTGYTSTNTNNAPVAGLELRHARPNPFTEATIIGFELPRPLRTQLVVSDVNGRVVYRHEADYGAGYHELQLDAADLPAAGVYHYQLRTEAGSVVRKVVKL